MVSELHVGYLALAILATALLFLALFCYYMYIHFTLEFKAWGKGNQDCIARQTRRFLYSYCMQFLQIMIVE